MMQGRFTLLPCLASTLFICTAETTVRWRGNSMHKLENCGYVTPYIPSLSFGGTKQFFAQQQLARRQVRLEQNFPSSATRSQCQQLLLSSYENFSSLFASVDDGTSRSESIISHDVIAGKKILVVGGSGRVGGSVVMELLKKRCGSVTVGGTTMENFGRSQDRWRQIYPDFKPAIDSVIFVNIDREDSHTVSTALQQDKYDLVINTAGPFQGKVNAPNGILKAALECKVPYIDVCDDYCTAMAAKAKFGRGAMEAGVSCIVSTGCWPGVSSLMAKQLTQLVLAENSTLKPQDLAVDFSFFTAGSGGAGATLLVATFLILAEKALTVVDGRRRLVQAMKNYKRVNFGPIVGDRDIAPLNLLETASINDVLGIGSVRSSFGTAPGFWNALLGTMAQLPPSLLSNEELMKKLAIFSLPIVRTVDFFAGATNAMRCDVTSGKIPGMLATAIYAHENLEPCVGECVVAFCAAILAGKVNHGVWFPEEAISAGDDSARVLNLASMGAHTVEATGSMINISKGQVWGNA